MRSLEFKSDVHSIDYLVPSLPRRDINRERRSSIHGFPVYIRKKDRHMILPNYISNRQAEITTSFMKLMEEHLSELQQLKAEKRFSVKDFAKMLYIQARHLTNTITLTTGKSPCEWMESRIIEEASRMLKETKMPVADIGNRFGFSDPSNFTKFFKGMVGITPLNFRKHVELAKI